MKKIPNKFSIAFISLIVLLLITTVGGAYAADFNKSEYYETQFEMEHIGITLLENETDVGHRDYFVTAKEKGQAEAGQYGWKVDSKPLFASIADFKVGETYKEVFKVKNSGKIDEYVRVVVYKYWVKDDANNTKVVDSEYDPDLVKLHLITNGNWILDESAHTKERDILYYKVPIVKDASTDPFADTLTISNEVLADLSTAENVTIEENSKIYKTVVYSYKYDGYKFCVEIEADAVQTHNAADAIKSAWGRDVTITDGVLSLD